MWGLWIVLITALIYIQSPVRQYGDSYYALLLSENLLSHGSFALDDYFRGRLDPETYPGIGATERQRLPYQIKRTGGHLYYVFPPGSSMLSIPAVVVGRLLDYRLVTEDGRYDRAGDERIQRRLAALLCALSVLFIFLAARPRLGLARSLLVAVGTGFGTSLWSTASRALWSQTWLVFLMSLVCFELLRLDSRPEPRPLRALWIGSLLGVAFWVRPTAAIPILLVGIWILGRHRTRSIRFFSPLIVSGALMILHSEKLYGRLLPFYYSPQRAAETHLWEALAGNLISPARGLLIFTPIVLWLAWLVLRRRKALVAADRIVLAVAVVGLHWWVISLFPQWWGGQCYGPRLMLDIVPWLALIAILGLQSWPQRHRTRVEHRLVVATGVVLLALSVGMHAAGAVARAANRWNVYPVNVDETPSRLWDWRHPQFLAWAQLEGSDLRHRSGGDPAP